MFECLTQICHRPLLTFSSNLHSRMLRDGGRIFNKMCSGKGRMEVKNRKISTLWTFKHFKEISPRFRFHFFPSTTVIDKCGAFGASAVASWMKIGKNAISHDFKRFFIFAFFSEKSFSFAFFRRRKKNETREVSFAISCFLPRHSSCSSGKNGKLLAVLQKFTNNTQSEASSMAFTNFHSCLKNSFYSLFWLCHEDFFRLFPAEMHALCRKWKAQNYE